ncbi:MAG: thermonuclease family protein [archaeon]|jgi:micrococcal nuclease|nr:thermonuclease family protein [archaeon]
MRKRILLTFVLLLVLSPVLFLADANSRERPKITFVQRVVDGDTLVLANGERVRLIGINSPEKGEPCFEEAGDFLASAVSGKAVELFFDSERQDKYGRTLAYVFVDEKHANLLLVKQGFAVAFPFEPNLRFAKEFSDAEQSARSQGRGCLWQ